MKPMTLVLSNTIFSAITQNNKSKVNDRFHYLPINVGFPQSTSVSKDKAQRGTWDATCQTDYH